MVSEMGDRIRALVLQQYYTSPDVTAVGMFNYWVRLAGYNPDLLMTLSFPRNKEKERLRKFFFYDYSDEEAENLRRKLGVDNVRFVRTSLARECFDAEQIQPINEDEWEFLLFKNLEKDAWDVIISGRYGIAPLGKLLQYKRKSQMSSLWRLPWISFITETEVDERLPALATNEARLMLAADMAVSDSVWCINEVDRERLVAVARDYLSPAFVAEVKRKIRRARPVINEEEMRQVHDEAVEPRKKMLEEGKVVFLHGGSLEPKRKVPLLLETVKRWREKGCLGNVEFKISYITEHLLREVNEYRGLPWVKLVKGGSREEYLDRLKTAHVGFLLPEYEGMGLTYIEMAASGMLMIYSRGMAREKAPPKYPYVCGSDSDLDDLIYVVSDAETIRREMDGWIAKLMEFTYENFGRKEAERTFGMVKEVVNANVESFNEKMVMLQDVAKEVLDGIEGRIEEDELLRMIGSKTRAGMSGKQVGELMTRIGIRLIARKMGFRDEGDFEKVVYSR